MGGGGGEGCLEASRPQHVLPQAQAAHGVAMAAGAQIPFVCSVAAQLAQRPTAGAASADAAAAAADVHLPTCPPQSAMRCGHGKHLLACHC